MAVDRSCFSNARKFAEFERIENSGAESGPLTTELSGAAASRSAPGLAEIWGYCCLWAQKVKVENRHVVSDSETAGVTSLRANRKGRFAIPNRSNALILALGGNQMDMGFTLSFLLSRNAIKICLDAYAAQGGNFVMLTLNRSGWAHAIAIKLDRGATGGLLNWRYPCALFDPNVGQGLYNNHDDMANDLFTLIQAYGMASSVRARVVGYQGG